MGGCDEGQVVQFVLGELSVCVHVWWVVSNFTRSNSSKKSLVHAFKS